MFKTALKFIFIWAVRLIVATILFISIFVITTSNLIIGIIWATLIITISIYAVFKPIPKIGLSSRVFSTLLVIIVGGLSVIIILDTYKFENLKETNPDEYLLKVYEKYGKNSYFAALEDLHPETFQAEIDQYKQEKERAAKELAEIEKLKKAETERLAAELADRRAKRDIKFEADYKKSLGDFPDGAAKRLANKAGIKRYAAYKLLNNPEVINEYCAYLKTSTTIEIEKFRQMDLTTVNAKQLKIEKEFELKQTGLLSDFNDKVGLRQFEYVPMSAAGNWRAYCNAK